MLAAESTAGAHFFAYIDIDDFDEESGIARRKEPIRPNTEYGPYLTIAVPADHRSIIRAAE